MKKYLAALTVLALLISAGCSVTVVPVAPETAAPTSTVTAAPTPEPAPTPSPTPTVTPEPAFAFTRDNLPRLNGSTSTVPLAEAVCSALLGEAREEVADLVRFSRTTNAYYALLNGEADLLIVGEANGEVLAEKEARGFEWLQTPFATDAFVFVVNENNPVDSITVEEARKIYTGEIANWAELGGDDVPIVALQRNSEAGSQTLMEKHVMQGAPMMDAPTDYIVTSMGGLMEAVKSYDTAAGAIGYSVYYYAEEMEAAKGLKLLKLEGVAPNPETIRSGEYPIVNPKYVVIAADAPADSPTRRLYDWLLSEEGQALIAAEGYVSIMDLESDVRPLAPVGVPWSGEWAGLEARTEGTPVTWYAGERLFHEWPAYFGCLYGLMTTEGAALTPPVYSSISRPIWYSHTIGGTTLPVLVLRQGEPDAPEDYGVQSRYTVAADDLSWVYPGVWRKVLAGESFLLLVGEDSLVRISLDGETLNRWDSEEYGLTPYYEELTAPWYDGPTGTVYEDCFIVGSDWTDESVVLFRFDSGELEKLPYLEVVSREPGRVDTETWRVMRREEGCRLTRDSEVLELPVPAAGTEARLVGDLVVFRNPSALYRLDGTELAAPTRSIVTLSEDESGPVLLQVVDLDSGILFFLRPDGSELPVSVRYVSPVETSVDAGLLGIIEKDEAAYYRISDGVCVFRTYFAYETAD